MLNMNIVGERCRRYRRRILKSELKEVATDVGYSVENVCAFEHGRNDNTLIFIWYLSKGLTINQIMGDDVIE